MKTILLTKGKISLVDDEDYDWLNQWKWQFGGHRYAVRTTNHNKKIYMHRLIMYAPQGIEVDHINGNELDNRKINLRLATRQQNQFNQKPRSLSGYKGVYLRKSDQKWVVYVKRKFIGSYKEKIEAAKHYNIVASQLYGEFARLNIII